MYESYIITYIDILGFKNLVSEKYKTKTKEVVDILNTFHFKVQNASTFYGYYGNEDVKIRSFSDMILRMIKFKYKNPKDLIGVLYYELTNVAWAQGILFEKGIFIRGAVDFGKLYVDEEHVFGEVFNNAHFYESQKAIYPIIVLSNRLSELISNANLQIKESFNNGMLSSIITNRYHDCNYIDFMLLSSRVRGVLEYELCDHEMLSYKKVLKKALRTYSNNVLILPKFLWLTDYYNYTVIRHKDILTNYKKLLLDAVVSKEDVHKGHAWMCSHDCSRCNQSS